MAEESETFGRKGSPTCSDEIRVLNDDPAAEDRLGAHSAVAEAIARLIEGQTAGNAVALEGEWGSGKSTVVEFLKQRLLARGTGRVFVFDGWAHEGDSLRRALVEEFSTWALEQRLVPADPKEQERVKANVDELAQRRSTATVDSKIALRPLGRLMVFLLALVPVGAALIAKATAYGHPTAGLCLVSLPAALFALVAACILLLPRAPSWVRKKLRRFRQTGPGNSEAGAARWDDFDALLGVFLRHVEKKTEEQRSSTPDPTSIEFHHAFDTVLRATLSRMGAAEKLVLVLDNIDRMEAGDAARAFSTLRVFFEGGSAPPAFWLLVPYDPGSLRSAGAQGPFIEGEAQRQAGVEDALRDKFFQAKFSVPPPVLLRWRDYLSSCLRDSLPGHAGDSAVIEGVCELFELARKDRASGLPSAPDAQRYALPTPREIRQFVNRIATVHLQWPCEEASTATAPPAAGRDRPERIPLILQAGFALREGEMTGGDGRRLRDLAPLVARRADGGGFFTAVQLSVMRGAVANVSDTGFQWERNIAAMWFGVPQDEALQMLLRPEISDAFSQGVAREGWPEGLAPHEEAERLRNVEGFWTIAQAVAREQIGAPDSRALDRCARTLSVLAKWKNEGEQGAGGWRSTWDAAVAVAIQTLSNPGSVLDSNDTSSDFGRNLAHAVSLPEAPAALAEAALQVTARFDARGAAARYLSWARETVAFMEAVLRRAAGRQDQPWWDYVVNFPVHGGPDALVYLVGVARQSNDQALLTAAARWALSAAQGQMIDALTRCFGTGKDLNEYAYALECFAAKQTTWPWAAVMEATLKRSQELQGLPSPARKALASAIKLATPSLQSQTAGWWGRQGRAVEDLHRTLSS